MKRKNENTNSKPSNSNSAKESEDFLKELDVFAEADESSEEQAASEANREDEQILEEVREIGIREPAEEETAEKVDEDENQKELLRFFLTGKKPGALKDLLPAQLTPALLHEYRDLTDIRYDYPLCLLDRPQQKWAMPLREIFDNLIDKQAGEEDEGVEFKRNLLRLESYIRSFARKNRKKRLTELWDLGIKKILEEERSRNQKEDVIQEQLATARESLEDDGILIEYGRNVPEILFKHAALITWQQKVSPFGTEIVELLNRLKDLLDADETRSPQSQSVKNLQASMGEIAGDELDLEVFSKIVSESEPARALPSERRKRIERIYHTLENRGNLYTGVIEGYEIEDEELQSILIGEHTAQDCQSALKKYESMTEEWVAFFKAVHIARLEVENQYREDKHDPFFADFNPDYVPSEEWELRPPIFLTLSSPKLNPADKSALIDILSSDMSIKILLQIDSFAQTEESASPSDIIHDWIAQLAQISVNLPDTFVLQGAAANIPVLLSGLEKGFGHDGPSLISIYTGISERDSSIAPYLKSAAAQEARIFPAIVNAPGDGDELATRFSIEFSPQYTRGWPASELEYLAADGQASQMQLEFTAADFFAINPHFADHYLPVPKSRWHRNMVPIGEFLTIAQEETEVKLPYIVMVDESGLIWRVICTYKMGEAVRKVAKQWRNFQELGGVKNSHALNLLAEEKERLQEQTQQQIEELKNQHQEEMERTVGDLTEEIVSRIAAGLLDERMLSQTAAPAPPRTAPKKEEEAGEAETEPAVAEEEAPEEEEEEAITIDEPYIDTPLCTSCNDCINKNNQMFAYNENKQAYIKDATAGTFRQLVEAAEACPVHIIHPGKPKNPDEEGLEELIKRAERFN